MFCGRASPCRSCVKGRAETTCTRLEGYQKCPAHIKKRGPPAKRNAAHPAAVKPAKRRYTYHRNPERNIALGLAQFSFDDSPLPQDGCTEQDIEYLKAPKIKGKVDVQADKPLPVGSPAVHAEVGVQYLPSQ